MLEGLPIAMKAGVSRAILDELACRMCDALLPSEGASETGVHEIAQALGLPLNEVEDALEMLSGERLVMPHALGRYSLTLAGLRKLRTPPA
jgi:DNA-binding IclR family transcriptional regulator